MRGLIGLFALAVITALAEALLLTAIVQGVSALGRGDANVELHLGALSRHVQVSALLAAALGAAIVRAGSAAWTAVLGPRITGESRERHRDNLVSAYLHATWAVQAADRTGRLQQVFSTSINEINTIVLVTTAALTALVTVVVLLSVAMILNPVMTTILLAAGVVIYVILRPLSLASRRAARVDSDLRIATASQVAVIASAGAEIKAFGATELAQSRVRHLIHGAETAFARANGLRLLSVLSTQSLAFVVAAGGLFAVERFDLDVNFTVLGTVALLLLRTAGLSNQVQQAFSLYGQMSPFISQVKELTENFERNRSRFGSVPFPTSDCTITLSDLGFAYPTSPQSVLDIPELVIEPGTAIAVVGRSGSGKSTLIQLLLRLRSPTHGHVRFGAADAASLETESFTRQVAFVPQAAHLIPGTIRENIQFYRGWISDQQIEKCARLAHIHNEIVKLPMGYDTALDAHVDMLSGGQKQRIALARALVTEPAVLILDEPTSALDATNEALVTQTLAQMRGQRTVIIITHRETTIAHCDVVMRLEAGRLIKREPSRTARVLNGDG